MDSYYDDGIAPLPEPEPLAEGECLWCEEAFTDGIEDLGKPFCTSQCAEVYWLEESLARASDRAQRRAESGYAQ